MNLQELIAKQQRLLDVAKAEKRDLSEEEKAEFDKLQRQIDEVKNNPNGLDLSETDLSGINLNGAEFVNVDLTASSFADSHLTEVKFDGCDLTSVDFTRAEVVECTFAGPADGESVLKECRRIKVDRCLFS